MKSVFILGTFLWIASSVTPVHSADPLDPSNSADYVIITHDDFEWAINDLAWHRESPAGGYHEAQIFTLTEIANAFSGGTLTTQTIIDFANYAADNWATLPYYLLLVGDANIDNGVPGSIAGGNVIPVVEEISEYDYLATLPNATVYPHEYAFVAPTGAARTKPLMRLGRIPAETAIEVDRYVSKVIDYETLPPEAVWRDRMLMVVGDEGSDNAIMKIYADNLWNKHYVPWNLKTRLYASENPTEAGLSAAVASEWNAGLGYVLAFGQTNGHTRLAQNVDMISTSPDYLMSALSETEQCPFVFAGSCLANYFYREEVLPGYPIEFVSVTERLLFENSKKGAVGCISSSHVALLDENYQFISAAMEGFMDLGYRDAGQLMTYAYVAFGERHLGREFVRNQYCLLGDPAIVIATDPTTGVRAEWATGAEVEDFQVSQNDVLETGIGIQEAACRVVFADGVAEPIRGERMIRFSLYDDDFAASVQVRAGIGEPMVELGENAVLSFWMRVAESPGDFERVVLGGQTSVGTHLYSLPSITDQDGMSLYPSSRSPVGDVWRQYYVDLSSLAGETLETLYAHYTAPWFSPEGGLTVYFDDIEITTGESGSLQRPTSELSNGDFEVDRNEDAVPDLWESKVPPPAQGGHYRDRYVDWNGEASMFLIDPQCVGQAARQSIYVLADPDRFFEIDFYAQATDADVPLVVSFLDPASGGTIIQTDAVPVTTTWVHHTLFLENPFPSGGSGGRILVDIGVGDCGSAAWIDNLRIRGGEDPILRETPLGTVGVSFSDTGFVQDTGATIPVAELFNWYVLAKADFNDIGRGSLNGTSGIAAWDASVHVPPEVTVTGRVLYPSESLNLGSTNDDNFIVGVGGNCLTAGAGVHRIVEYTGILLSAANDVFVRPLPADYGPTTQLANPQWSDCTSETGRPFGASWATNWIVVNPSTTEIPPVPVLATREGSDTIRLVFDEELDPMSATDPSNYAVYYDGQPLSSVPIESVALLDHSNTVTLKTEGAIYGVVTWDVDVLYMKDVDGDELTQTTTVPVDTQAVPASIQITEIMFDPVQTMTEFGQWFEVRNTGNDVIDLQGWTIETNEGSHVIDAGGALLLEPGQYGVFARDRLTMEAEGVAILYEYGNTAVLDTDVSQNYLRLRDAFEETPEELNMDQAWPGTSGASIEWDETTPDNDHSSTWSVATSPFGAGDKGTPGQPNDTVTSTDHPSLREPRLSISPNPFNPRTQVSFAMSKREHGSLIVYDVRGRVVRTLANGTIESGRHVIQWDGKDEEGNQVASGVYMVRLQTESNVTIVRKASLLK